MGYTDIFYYFFVYIGYFVVILLLSCYRILMLGIGFFMLCIGSIMEFPNNGGDVSYTILSNAVYMEG